jgi:hypothetical protein
MDIDIQSLSAVNDSIGVGMALSAGAGGLSCRLSSSLGC